MINAYPLMLRLLFGTFFLLGVQKSWAYEVNALKIEKTLSRLDHRHQLHANQVISELHRQLSLALRSLLGNKAGANFHTWARWGSMSAGQNMKMLKSLGQALKPDSHLCAFLPETQPLCLSKKWSSAYFNSKLKAMLEGNLLVMKVVGTISGEFYSRFKKTLRPSLNQKQEFITWIRSRLKGIDLDHEGFIKAYDYYWQALYEEDLELKAQYALLANLLITEFEQALLQPLIQKVLPIFNRLWPLHFKVADEIFYAHEDVPLFSSTQGPYPLLLNELKLKPLQDFYQKWDRSFFTFGSGASDWSDYPTRLNYFCSLFRTRHFKPDLF